MKRLCCLSILGAVAAYSCLPPTSYAQRRGDVPADDSQAELIVKVYQVADLVMPTPSHPYEGIQLPGKASVGSGMGGGGAGGGMSGGGMPGGGMPGGGGAPPRQRTATADGEFGVQDLVRAIAATVEPDFWSDVGGPGTIMPWRNTLLVKQTRAVHEQIAGLLDELRSQGGALRTVTVRAQWLLLEPDELAALAPSEEGAQRVNREALDTLRASVRRYQGQITCFDGQTVHIVSGRLRTVVQGAIPIVGGEAAAAYQPVMSSLHAGALLEVTPTLVSGTESVVLDLASYVTRWDKPGEPIQFPAAFNLERINVVAHQFATTLRAPLGQPVVAGGLTLEQPEPSITGEEPPKAVPAAPSQLYLIIEATAAEREPTSASKRNSARPTGRR